jgi:hypothetical protein
MAVVNFDEESAEAGIAAILEGSGAFVRLVIPNGPNASSSSRDFTLKSSTLILFRLRPRLYGQIASGLSNHGPVSGGEFTSTTGVTGIGGMPSAAHW